MANSNTPSLGAPPTDPALLPAWCAQVKAILDFNGLTGAATPVGSSITSSTAGWTPISSTNLVGAPQNIAIPASPRYAYVVAALRHCRSVNNGPDLWLRFNIGAGVDGGNNYNYAARVQGTSATGADVGAAALSRIPLSDGESVANTSTKGWSGLVTLPDPGDASHHPTALFHGYFRNQSSGLDNVIVGGGAYVGAVGALTQIQLLWSDGSNFLDGKCDLFGFGTP